MKLHHTILFVFLFTLLACQPGGFQKFGSTLDNTFDNTYNSSSSQKQFTVATPIRVIPNGEQLKQLQRFLINKGYNLGAVDGIGGRKTTGAIKAYQRANGLNVDGIASFQLLNHLDGGVPGKNAILSSVTEGTIADRCVKSGNGQLTALKNALFESITSDLEIDISSYLAGFCVPADQTKLAKLYIFLVTEGVIHSRLATTKYYNLVSVFEKAGVELAVNRDGLRRSTEALRGDVRKTAEDRMSGASALVSNSFEVEDNSEFQENLKSAYEQIDQNSQYKREARQLLSEVLTHSSSSTFYLARSAYTIDRLSNYFGINVRDGINVMEQAEIFLIQVGKNMKLAYFLLSKQTDLSDMLISSTYNIKALTEDIKDIPRTDSRQATLEVRKLKEEEGLTMDDMEIDFDRENTPRLA